MNKYLYLPIFAVLLSGCGLAPAQTQTSVKLIDPQITVITPTEIITNSPTPMAQKITATIHTSLGDMKINLFPDKAPNTVANFVGLSNGTKDWTNPKTGQKVTGKPLYQNLIFHRVIEDFMVQGGDPLGSGMGGPGYKFADEPVTDSYLRGTLAMANSGPNTNGSQFFIVHKDYPLPKNYTIFGRIDPADTASLATLDKIATTPTATSDRPVTDVIIESIDITEE
jgi:peptidyl-prolyl cis-trans isomerase A (cyclophilin A)